MYIDFVDDSEPQGAGLGMGLGVQAGGPADFVVESARGFLGDLRVTDPREICGVPFGRRAR